MESLDEVDRQAIEKIAPQIRDHLDLTTDAFNQIGRLSSKVPEIEMREAPRSLLVSQKLLLRLSNDIHCIERLSARGYPLQAMSIASAAYEVAYTIAYICGDDKLAQKWLDHSDPTIPFRQARELTHGGLAKLGITEELETQTAIEYRVYRQFCWAKHASPILEKNLGIERRGDLLVAVNGPDLSDAAIKAAWFTLEHCAGFAFIAMSSFLQCHLPRYCPEAVLKELTNAVESIGERRKSLEGLAIKRWGAEDPFPGKW